MTWDEVVTTALLGTDRRPLPDAGSDPADRLLRLAAEYRAVAQAGSPLPRCEAPPTAPPERLPLAPPTAQDVMAGLLARPEPGLVNLWLAVSAERGMGLAPELWTRLANLAARNTDYDRQLLATVLGPRGRWFLHQNPSWTRLAADVTRPASPPELPSPTSDLDPATALAYADRPDSPARAVAMILACPDPWSTQLVLAALRLIASGSLGADTRVAASRLSYRIPRQAWSELAEVAESDLLDAPVPAALMRTVQLSLTLVQRTVEARIQIDDAFAGSEPSDHQGEPPP